ncbi:substrate-binding periplasmic protein [Rhodoferax aquaticus]|uniref:Transporter substrate-binding domain-containing protein n=1 Tax=Rhodoferax aquaticus TaxID=2527691 RepID=A0A515EJF6_9BURK|nr:transporter substrate-binding domain-containing protein [Rhodoferax aquaticus]QDL52795.1 transporter substrate-binding domain-containing protein [Rhodoferax aquaticus]
MWSIQFKGFMRRLWAFIVCVLLLGSARAQERITLVGEDDWYPYAAARHGKAHGLGVDIITAAYQSVGVEVNFRTMPYARCMAQVKAGQELGCFDSAPDSQLNADYLFHQTPLFDATIGIYAMASSKERNLAPQHLKGQRVGFTNGYTYGDAVELDHSIARDVARTDLLNLRKLLLGRTAYSLVYTRVVDHLQATHPQELGGKIKQVGVVMNTRLFVSFSKLRPESARYAKLLDQGLKNLHTDHSYAQILQRWNTAPP